MPAPIPSAIEWPLPQGLLRAIRPTARDIDRHARAMAAFFNDAHNRRMMGNTIAMDTNDVREHYTTLVQAGDAPFFLFLDDALVGDADFRAIAHRRAEYTIAIGPRAAQGKGLGRAFALLTHAYAFAHLPVDRVMVAILPHNHASLRMFRSIGYQADQSPEARALAEADDESTLSISRSSFEEDHAGALAHMRPVP